MKRLFPFLLLLPFCARLGAEDVLPKGATADRYKAIWERAPFTVASAADEPKATWVLAGLAESDTDPVLYLLNKDTQERMTVTREANAKGFSIVSIRYDAAPLRTSAEVKVPGQAQPIEVRFDPALLVVNNPAPSSPSGSAAANAAAPGAAAGDVGEDRPWRRRSSRRTAVPNPTGTPTVTPSSPATPAAPASAPVVTPSPQHAPSAPNAPEQPE